jgi:hypothetical protein
MIAWKVVEPDIPSREDAEMVWAELRRRSALPVNTRRTWVISCPATLCGQRDSEIWSAASTCGTPDRTSHDPS